MHARSNIQSSSIVNTLTNAKLAEQTMADKPNQTVMIDPSNSAFNSNAKKDLKKVG